MQYFLSMSFMLLLLSNCNTQNRTVLKENKSNPTIEAYMEGKDLSKYAVATFAGGCFWCTEASFERIEGVQEVISGYAGGERPNPTYREVANGLTKHAESIQVFYDPTVISYARLLDVFFVAHDPTTLNRQGPDVGPHYRSEIFYHSEEELAAAKARIKALDDSGVFASPIVTKLSAYEEFWVAEEYHQDYYGAHPENPYIQQVSRPKVEKVEKLFKDILKKEFKQ